MIKKQGIYLECEYCGKPIYRTQYQYKRRKHHFCSNRCQGLMKMEKTRITSNCEVCGKEMRFLPSKPQRFCSQACQNEWQRHNTGFKNPKFRGGYLICESCGKEFLVNCDRLNRKTHHFCSTECRQHWYATVLSQSAEWKEACRIRSANLLSTNEVVTQTHPQVLVNSILTDLDIKYTNEKSFDYYSVDNYLDDYNLVIEVMGDYWHSSPIKYNRETINHTQRSVIPRDKAKHTYLKNQYGIDILYLWEKDILVRPQLCVMLILNYVENNGHLENYNSFNYTLSDDVLILNQNIIYPLQELKAS